MTPRAAKHRTVAAKPLAARLARLVVPNRHAHANQPAERKLLVVVPLNQLVVAKPLAVVPLNRLVVAKHRLVVAKHLAATAAVVRLLSVVVC